MTNAIPYPMQSHTAIRVLPPMSRAEREAARRARKRRMFWNTVLDALASFGVITCMILCAVAIVCVV